MSVHASASWAARSTRSTTAILWPRRKWRVRGGNKAGEHEVHFLGTDEELVITHRATSKRVFAEGAVKAAAFLLTQKPGFYTMKDVIKI